VLYKSCDLHFKLGFISLKPRISSWSRLFVSGHNFYLF